MLRHMLQSVPRGDRSCLDASGLREQLLQRVDDPIRRRDIGFDELRDGNAGHPGGLGGSDARGGVLESESVLGRDAEPLASEQVEVRRGLVMRNVIGAHDGIEGIGESGAGERGVDQESGRVRSEPQRHPATEPLDELPRTRTRLHVGLQLVMHQLRDLADQRRLHR